MLKHLQVDYAGGSKRFNGQNTAGGAHGTAAGADVPDELGQLRCTGLGNAGVHLIVGCTFGGLAEETPEQVSSLARLEEPDPGSVQQMPQSPSPGGPPT